MTTVHITLSEALLGFSRVLITHLDGHGVKVSSPKGKILKPGFSIVLRGQGMPVRKSPSKGDLFVVFELEMPPDSWLTTVDHKVSSLCSCPSNATDLFQLLAKALPPRKPEAPPNVTTVDEGHFEQADISQFDEDEEDWVDEEEEEVVDCQHQ
jgi:DnaJ homolog subfamily A member 2